MNLSLLDPSKYEAKHLHLVHPATNEPLMVDGKPITVKLLGMSSDKARKILAELKKSGVDMSVLNPEKSTEADVEQTEEQTEEQALEQEALTADVLAEVLTALTLGCSNNIETDDGKVKFSKSAIKKLYVNQKWIAEQAIVFVANPGNFAPKM